jgi:hypothetical protein
MTAKQAATLKQLVEAAYGVEAFEPTRSKYWIAASPTREGAVPGLERKFTSPNEN